jgi:choline-glycine betaine transporter
VSDKADFSEQAEWVWILVGSIVLIVVISLYYVSYGIVKRANDKVRPAKKGAKS